MGETTRQSIKKADGKSEIETAGKIVADTERQREESVQEIDGLKGMCMEMTITQT